MFLENENTPLQGQPGKKKPLAVKTCKNFAFVLDVGLPHVKVEDIVSRRSAHASSSLKQ